VLIAADADSVCETALASPPLGATYGLPGLLLFYDQAL
jgi:hypothetical protein